MSEAIDSPMRLCYYHTIPHIYYEVEVAFVISTPAKAGSQ